MGRPISPNFIGQQIQCNAWLPYDTEIRNGYIVDQKTANSYEISNNVVDNGICRLVQNVTQPAQCNITVQSFGSTTIEHAEKITTNQVVTFEGNVYLWFPPTFTLTDPGTAIIMVPQSPVVPINIGSEPEMVATFVQNPTYGFNNPGGQYNAGKDLIWLSGTMSPESSESIAFTLSTSNNIVPTGPWQVSTFNTPSNSWTTACLAPSVPGNYYVWLKTSTDSYSTSSFTISVID